MIIKQVIVTVLLPCWRLHPLHKLLMILCPRILQGLLQRVGQRVDGTNRHWSYTQRRKTNAASANLQSTLLVCVHSGYCDSVSSFVTLRQKRKRMMFFSNIGTKWTHSASMISLYVIYALCKKGCYLCLYWQLVKYLVVEQFYV